MTKNEIERAFVIIEQNTFIENIKISMKSYCKVSLHCDNDSDLSVGDKIRIVNECTGVSRVFTDMNITGLSDAIANFNQYCEEIK